jgi:hypothetical protein
MEWQKLDIRKASVLKKQVDLGLQALKTAISEGDNARRSSLVQSFLVQIDEIEEFRSMNDSDERSILFERERLRLRKAVQENSSSSAAATIQPQDTGSPKARKGLAAQRNPDGSYRNTLGVSFDEEEVDSPSIRSKGGSPAREPAAPANIYSWENPDIVKPLRRPIAIEGTIFAPSEMDGVYVKDDENLQEELAAVDESKSPAGAQDKYVDMYFVLTAEEVSTLASRLQHNKSHDKQLFKNAGSAQGVQHSTPYVDNARIENMLYRETQKERWTDQKDMRPNAK